MESEKEKYIDTEKGVKVTEASPYVGPPADPGLFAGKHEPGLEPTGIWGKFDRINKKLERTLGIETVRHDYGVFADFREGSRGCRRI